MRNAWTEITATDCPARLGLTLDAGDRAWLREVDADDGCEAAVYIARPPESERCDTFVDLAVPCATPRAIDRWVDDGGRAQ